MVLRPLIIASACVLVLTLSGCGDGATPGLSAAKRFDGFKLYYLGKSFHGLRLTDVSRGPGRRAWSFIYGSCNPGDGEQPGCAPPLEVQDWSACERHLALHRGRELKPSEFRGAKAIGHHEIYTGRTTVVIFGGSDQAARALRPVGSKTARPRLKPPVDGALQGRLPCQHDRGGG